MRLALLAAVALLAACGAARPAPADDPAPETEPGPPPDAAPPPAIRSTLAGIPVGALLGRVTDGPGGKGLDLVRLKALADGQRLPHEGFTEPDGKFFVKNVRVTTYEVVISREGFAETTVTGVTIPQGAAALLCVPITRAGGTMAWDGGAACEAMGIKAPAPTP